MKKKIDDSIVQFMNNIIRDRHQIVQEMKGILGISKSPIHRIRSKYVSMLTLRP